MGAFSEKTYDEIGLKLALGFSQDDAVSLVTGRDKKAVNKYAYQICKNEKVTRALAKYKEEFEKQAVCDKELMEREAMRYVFGDKAEELKPETKLKYMQYISMLNGHTAKDQIGKMNAETSRGAVLANLANKINNG